MLVWATCIFRPIYRFVQFGDIICSQEIMIIKNRTIFLYLIKWDNECKYIGQQFRIMYGLWSDLFIAVEDKSYHPSLPETSLPTYLTYISIFHLAARPTLHSWPTLTSPNNTSVKRSTLSHPLFVMHFAARDNIIWTLPEEVFLFLTLLNLFHLQSQGFIAFFIKLIKNVWFRVIF